MFKKIGEITAFKDFMKNFMDWECISDNNQESPDYIIENRKTGEVVGVEITTYYPHINKKKQAIIFKENDKYKYFDKTETINIRIVPNINQNDLETNTIREKEKKIDLYRKKDIDEIWLLISLDFYDDVDPIFKHPIKTKFNKIFIIDTFGVITKIPIRKL